MLDGITLRAWYLTAAFCCAGLLAFAFYQQYQAFLDPCPLCIFQRIGFMWIGLVALLAAIHNPARAGRVVYSLAMVLGAGLGASVSGRHVWLQNLPPDQVPECGPGLNYMLETLPLSEVLAKVFIGDGNCAEIHWTFLGLSMPGWTLLWFIGLAIVTLWFTFRTR